MTEIETENEENYYVLCRICGKNSKCVLDIFNFKHNGKTLVEMLSFCFNRKIEKNDGSPANICLACESNLLTVYAFHTLCYDSKRQYREIIPSVTEVKNEYEICRICGKDSKCLLDFSEHDNRQLVEILPIFLNQVIGSNDGSGSICLDCESKLIIVREFHALSNNTNRRFHEIRRSVEKISLPVSDTSDTKIQRGSKESRLNFKSRRTEETYRCCVCDKNCTDRSSLSYHIQSTHEIKYFMCDVDNCNFSHKTRAGLRFHMQTKHSESSHICEICAKEFNRKGDLARHEQIIQKPHACNICGSSFSDKPGLRRHIIIHSDERPFVCKVCEKSYKTRNVLLAHERSHTGERPFKCKTCAKTFPASGSFWVHMRTHAKNKPYVCEVCQLPFAQRHHLTQHMRAHTGERPFVCEVCQYAFGQIGHLRTHQKTHNRDSRFVCKICPSAFPFKSQLSSHERIHSDALLFSCAHCDKLYASKHLKKCFNEHGFENRV